MKTISVAVLARKMHRLGRISCKVLIFRGIKFVTQISAAFAEPHRPWLHFLSGVPITCYRATSFSRGSANVKRPSRKSDC